MAFLNASRQKQEDDKVNLVEKAAKVYPACLDFWFATHAAESPPSLEVWSTHPDNKGRGKGVEPRRYTVEDSKKYRASSAWNESAIQNIIGRVKTTQSSLEYFSILQWRVRRGRDRRCLNSRCWRGGLARAAVSQ